MESCKLLRQKYGRRLKVGSELQRWARGVRDNRKQMAELAASRDAELEVLPKVAPKLAKAMNKRRYQRVGTRFVADNSASLISDEPGLGKTLIALGGILEAEVPGPYLVIAPKIAARSVWAREINWRLPREHRAITMPETRLARERKLRLTNFHETTWLIVHPEMMLCQTWYVCQTVDDKTGKPCGKRSKDRGKQRRVLDCGHIKNRKTVKVDEPAFKRLFDIKWGAVIVDESHESLIRRGGVPTQRRNGMDKLTIRPDGLRIAMSGTPMKGKPEQLWGTLNWLSPKQYSAFYRWAELYWQRGGKTGYEIGEFRADREQMLWDSLSAIAIRRTKLEVAEDLPPKIYVGTPHIAEIDDSPVGIWLEMEGKQARAYEQMNKAAAAELDSGRLEAITALAELTRLKQLACSFGDIDEQEIYVDGELEYRHRFFPTLPSNKFDWSVEMLEEWGFPHDPVTKVIFASNYTSVLGMFAANFERHFRTKPNKPMTCLITGKNANTREAVLDRFNESDNETVMLLNTRAGGTAITIDTADKMVFISETRDPDQQTQTEDRIHRVSNPRHCMYYYLRSLGTVDVGTAMISAQRDKETRRLLDVRRGVNYVRQVINLSR